MVNFVTTLYMCPSYTALCLKNCCKATDCDVARKSPPATPQRPVPLEIKEVCTIRVPWQPPTSGNQDCWAVTTAPKVFA